MPAADPHTAAAIDRLKATIEANSRVLQEIRDAIKELTAEVVRFRRDAR